MALAEHKLEADFERTERPLTEEESKELTELIELYGGSEKAFTVDWHRASFKECFALVKARWQEYEDSGESLAYIYDVLQRRNNLMIHPSPTAFRQTFAASPDGRRNLNRAGPDQRWVEALTGGAGAFYMIMRVLAEEFELDKEPAAESFSRTTNLLKRIENTPEVLELPADAPCPCGSGFTVSQCHRS